MSVRVPIAGAPGKVATLNPRATEGAVLGESLFWPDGRVVAASELAAPAVQTVEDTLAKLVPDVRAEAAVAKIDATAAATAAANAQAAANNANAALADIASDSLLTPGEKPLVIRDNNVIISEQAGIDAQAAAYSITTERVAYNAAVSALTAYLATLTSPYVWSNLVGNTSIVGATFRQKFADVYTTRQALLNRIAQRAQTLAMAASAGRNLIANGSFEFNSVGTPAGGTVQADQAPFVDNWKVVTPGTRPTSFARWAPGYAAVSGNYSAQLTMYGELVPAGATHYGAAIEYTGQIQLKAGDRYRLRAHVGAFFNSGLSGCSMSALVYLIFYNSSGASLGLVTVGRSTQGGMFDSSVVGDVPAGTASIRMVIQPTIANATGAPQTLTGIPIEMVVDDIELTIVTNLDADVSDGTTYGRFGLDDGYLVGGIRRQGLRFGASGHRLGDARNVMQSQVNAYGSVRNTTALTATSAGAVSVNAFSFRNGSISVAYNAVSNAVTGLTQNTRYVIYCIDDAFAGGVRTWLAGTTPDAVMQLGDGVVIAGEITIPTSGTGSGGGGSGTGGSGNDWCVDADMLLACGTRAGDATAGQRIAVWNDDPANPALEWLEVESNTLAPDQPCHRLTSASGAVVIASDCTPMTLPDGRIVRFDAMAGERVLVLRDGVPVWEPVAELVPVSPRTVAKIKVHQRCYFAGTDRTASIATHNPIQKP